MVSVFSAWKQHVRTQLYLTQRLQHLKSVNCLREAFEGWRQLYQAKAQRRFLGDWIEHLHNQRSVAQRFALWKSGFHSRQQHWASLEHAVELRRLKVWFLQWRVLSVSLQCADFMSRGHSLRACFAHWKTALKRVRNMRQASQYRRQRLLHCLLAKWRTQLQRLAVLRSLLLQCESRRTDLRLRRTFVTWRRAFRSQITDRKLSSLVAYFQKQYRVLPRLRAWFRLSQQWAPLRKLESDFVKPTRVRFISYSCFLSLTN
jgi:hypothetical protein